MKDVAEGTFHCCYCGRRFRTEAELRNHYKLWGNIHMETSVFEPCKAESVRRYV
ncbi:MAG: hypothetical protein HA494_04455 [Thaumarchaeota archaeon]|nr:hypothetical protein [Nitrososphaerota archaeon]